tara:strand:+ start:403 stop:1320 length:918 start_codon:yes stop_codon:yes gene_type:complete
MFCTNCGNKIESGQNFCTSCGSPASSAKKEIQRDVQRQANQTTEKQWTTGRIIKYAVVTVIVVGLLIIKLGISAYNSVEGEAIDTNNRGIAAMDSGNTDEAVRNFSDAAESATTNSNKLNSLKNLGYTYASNGDVAEAIQAFSEALKLTDSGSFEFYLVNGEIQYLQGNPQAALNNYNRAYDIKPNNFQINNALNLFYLDLEDIYPEYYDASSALVYAKKAYETSEYDVKGIAAQNLALAYYFSEDYNSAITYLEKSNQNDPYTHYWLGLAYISLGDEATGRTYLQNSVDMGAEVPPEITEYLYY